MTRTRSSSVLAAAVLGGATALAALVGVRATSRGKKVWYRALRKPSFTPPDAAFGPAWTAMYTLSAVSAYRVWRAPSSPARSRALGLWGTQLALNAAWSPLFFGAHRPRAALADIAGLGTALTAYARQAHKVDRSASYMVVPYLGWVGFASALNVGIVRKNRGPFALLTR